MKKMLCLAFNLRKTLKKNFWIALLFFSGLSLSSFNAISFYLKIASSMFSSSLAFFYKNDPSSVKAIISQRIM